MERRPRVTFLVVRLGGYPPTLLRGARRKRLCPHQIPSIPRSIRTRAISLLTVRTCRTHTTTRGAARRAVYVVGRREPRVTSRALARVTRGKDVTRVCLTRPRPGSCVVTPRPAFSFLSMVQTRLVGVRWTIDGEGGVLARTLIDEAPEGRLDRKRRRRRDSPPVRLLFAPGIRPRGKTAAHLGVGCLRRRPAVQPCGGIALSLEDCLVTAPRGAATQPSTNPQD